MPFWPAVADLGKYLGRDLAASTVKAQQALDVAVGLVQGEASQVIEVVTDDELTLSPVRGERSVWLPELPVTAVSSIVVDDVELAPSEYYLDGPKGRVIRLHHPHHWGHIPGSIVVTYTHGRATCPRDLWGVVLQVAARIYDNPQGRIEHQTDGSKSVLPGVFPLELSRTELKIVARYAPPLLA